MLVGALRSEEAIAKLNLKTMMAELRQVLHQHGAVMKTQAEKQEQQVEDDLI